MFSFAKKGADSSKLSATMMQLKFSLIFLEMFRKYPGLVHIMSSSARSKRLKIEKKKIKIPPFAKFYFLSFLYTWGRIRGQWCWLGMPWLPAKLWGCPREYGGSTACPPRHFVWLWHGASFSICKIKHATVQNSRLFKNSDFFGRFSATISNSELAKSWVLPEIP